MEIYADVVFFINFIMDFLIFWIVSKLLKKKTDCKKIILGTIVAAGLYCMIMFVPVLMKFYNFFAALAILMISAMIAFKPRNVGEMLKIVFLFHISAFAIGGAGIALFYYIDLSNVIGNMISFDINNFPFKVLIAVTAGSYIIIKISIGWIKSLYSKNKQYYNISVSFENKEVTFKALLDTGNSLQDPLTSTPVIVAEFSAVKKFLPDTIKLIYYEKKEENLTEVLKNITDSDICNRIRMIPFSSVGVKNGMLLGFVPDKVEVENEEKKIQIKNVVLAIYNYQLSKEGNYQALINPDIFE